MKAILILLFSSVVLITVYFILQRDHAGAPSSAAATVNTGVVTAEPEVVEEFSGDSDKSATAAAVATSNQNITGQTSPDREKPLEPEIRAAVQELVNTSHEGLVEEKTQNGEIMDLKGRFRTAPVATVNEKGEVTVRDYTSAPVE